MEPDDLINVKHLPPGFRGYQARGLESTAYYDMNAYPFFAFQSWKTEDMGPYPRCTPINYAIIRRFALWLFGKEVNWQFTSNDDVDKKAHELWQLNAMDSKLVNLAIQGGKEGAVSIKFSYDPKGPIPVKFQILSDLHQVKYFYNPLDTDDLWMARIQMPYYDFNDGQWYWYREEWTKDWYVTYEPVPIQSYVADPVNPYKLTGIPSLAQLDEYEKWTIDKQVKNRFGVIPVVQIKNWDNGSAFGSGDLFGLQRIIDRINLTYHLMDKSNQLYVDPETIFMDLEPMENDSLDSPTKPGGKKVLKTREPESDEAAPPAGKVEFLETSGDMRTHLRDYANDFKEMLFDATGAVFPRQENVTNKGALTQSVLIQMYAPMIETIGEKRKCYANLGLANFIKILVTALKNIGYDVFKTAKLGTSLQSDEMTVTFTWFDQFMLSEDEKFACFDRIDRMTRGGYIPNVAAVKKVAKLEELKLSDEEIEKQAALIDERIEQTNDTGQPRSGNAPGGSEQAQRGNSSEQRGKQTKQSGRRKQQGRGPKVKDAN